MQCALRCALEDTARTELLEVQLGQCGIFVDVKVQVVPVSRLNVEEVLNEVILQRLRQVDKKSAV